MNELSRFKAYDISDDFGVNINEKTIYRIGRANKGRDLTK